MKGTNILDLILEATPSDEWVRANEIAEKTGLTTHAVGALIGFSLLQYIERKRTPDTRFKSYLYKRIN